MKGARAASSSGHALLDRCHLCHPRYLSLQRSIHLSGIPVIHIEDSQYNVCRRQLTFPLAGGRSRDVPGQNDYILGYMNDVDLRLLRIFCTIVECGGITAAEAALNMANSTLSTHLTTLEDHLQLKLCQRGRAGFSLTSEGRQVYEAALRMFQSLEEFRRSIPAAHAESRGEIKFLVP